MPPWEAYRWGRTAPDAPPGITKVTERLPFRVRAGATPPPGGYDDMTCLAEMAANAGEPGEEMCEFLRDLAGAEFLGWDRDSRSKLLTVPDDAGEDAPLLSRRWVNVGHAERVTAWRDTHRQKWATRFSYANVQYRLGGSLSRRMSSDRAAKAGRAGPAAGVEAAEGARLAR
ncbi:MAG: hypothetical protein ACRD4I_04965 [Candidatus Angelobacter sp.]